jgi:hypothetical protein
MTPITDASLKVGSHRRRGPYHCAMRYCGMEFPSPSLENLQQLTTVPTIATEAQLTGDKSHAESQSEIDVLDAFRSQ